MSGKLEDHLAEIRINIRVYRDRLDSYSDPYWDAALNAWKLKCVNRFMVNDPSLYWLMKRAMWEKWQLEFKFRNNYKLWKKLLREVLLLEEQLFRDLELL